MLFIKTSKCFTVHCSFTLPAGAGAVIPVSEGSDGGHCWPVGVCSAPQVHRASPDYITAFILTNGISWWGIPRVMGIKIPGPAPTRRLPCGAQQIRCTCRDCCSSLYISTYKKGKTTENQQAEGWFISADTKIVRDQSSPCTVTAPWPSWIRHRLQLNERVSDDGELWDARAAEKTLNVNFLPWMTLLDMFWSFPALQPELMKEDWVRNPELGGGIKRLGWNKSHVSLCRPYKERWQRRACWEIQDIITERERERVWGYRFAPLSSSLLYFKPSCSVAAVLKTSACVTHDSALHLSVTWRLGDSLKETHLGNNMKSTPPPSDACTLFASCLSIEPFHPPPPPPPRPDNRKRFPVSPLW